MIKNENCKLGIVAHIYTSNSTRTEAGGMLQASLDCNIKSCLKGKN